MQDESLCISKLWYPETIEFMLDNFEYGMLQYPVRMVTVHKKEKELCYNEKDDVDADGALSDVLWHSAGRHSEIRGYPKSYRAESQTGQIHR